MSSKSRIRALISRIAVLSIFFYLFRSIYPLISGVGLIGAIMGFAGGIYIDRGIRERSIGDNVAFGLTLSARMRLADVYFSISSLTPTSWKLGLSVASIAAAIAALSSEISRGTPARIPLLGLLAVIVAFVLVFSAVSLHAVNVVEHEINYMLAETSYTHDFKTFSSTSNYITIDSGNGTIVGINLKYKPPLEAGRYNITLIFVPAVHKPRILTWTQGQEREVVHRNVSEVVSVISFEINVTPADALKFLSENLSYIYIDRHDRMGFNDSTRPTSITIQLHVEKLGEYRVNKLYFALAMIALVIAAIDAFPEDVRITRRSRRRRSRR